MIKFGDVFSELTGMVYKGDIDSSKKDLDSLLGSPKEVDGEFLLHDNNLTSLKYAPKKVNGTFGCRRNKLKSLVGGPEFVNGSYYVRNNHLSSIRGIAKTINGVLDLRGNKFKNIEDILTGLSGTKVDGLIKTDFADFTQYDVDTYSKKMNKLGSFKDFLGI